MKTILIIIGLFFCAFANSQINSAQVEQTKNNKTALDLRFSKLSNCINDYENNICVIKQLTSFGKSLKTGNSNNRSKAGLSSASDNKLDLLCTPVSKLTFGINDTSCLYAKKRNDYNSKDKIVNSREVPGTSLEDLINQANANKILCIQQKIVLVNDITLADNIVLKDCGGEIDLNGFTLTGQNTGLIISGKKMLINAFTGVIKGSWDTPLDIYATNFGLKPDAKEYKDGTMMNGSAILTSATANFTDADIGKPIGVMAANHEYIETQPSASRGTVIGTIISVQSPTQVTLSEIATRTVSNTYFRYGSDNYIAGRNALYVRNRKSGNFIFPTGNYMKREVEYPLQSRLNILPNTWFIGDGTDDIHVKGNGSRLMSIPHGITKTHFFKTHNTKRSSFSNLFLDGEFNYHNHVGNYADEPIHGLVIGTASYNTTIKNVSIVNFTGDGFYMTGDLQFTNAIKGSAVFGYPGVSEFEIGTIGTNGIFETDQNKIRTNTMIDLTGHQFEKTRVATPDRNGNRHYQFSGSSFAGWSGLKNPVYTAYFYGKEGMTDFLGKSTPREFYKTYEYPDNVHYMHIVMDKVDDLTIIDAQVRAPLDPRYTLLDNVNISDCGRHGGANLGSYTTWTNSVIKNIGNTLPAFGINIEDQRRAATNFLFQNVTFKDCYSGGLNLVGTVNVDVIACKFEGTTAPGRLLHPEYFGAMGLWRGRNVNAINNYVSRGSASIGRSGVISNLNMEYGDVAFELNGSKIMDSNLHQTAVNIVGGQGATNRVKSLFKGNTMTYDRSLPRVFDVTNMEYDIIDVTVKVNDVSRLSNLVTPESYEEIVLNSSNYLFNQTPTPTKDYGGIIEDFSFSGARPERSKRDFVSYNSFPVTDMKDVYSESSISLAFGLPKDRCIKNLTIDGWLELHLTQFENSMVSKTPTITFENLQLTIPESQFDWTNTGAYIFETKSKNVNVVINKGKFDLQKESGVIGSSNRYMKLAQLGSIEFNEVTFISASPKVIDFTNKIIYPSNTGPITIRNPKLKNISFVLRPQDRLIYTELPNISTQQILDGQVLAWNATKQYYEPVDYKEASVQYNLDKTASLSNAHSTVNFNNGANLTYTIPKNTVVPFDIGAKILVNNENADLVTIVPEPGVSLVGGKPQLNGKEAAYLIHLTTDEWLIINLN